MCNPFHHVYDFCKRYTEKSVKFSFRNAQNFYRENAFGEGKFGHIAMKLRSFVKHTTDSATLRCPSAFPPFQYQFSKKAIISRQRALVKMFSTTRPLGVKRNIHFRRGKVRKVETIERVHHTYNDADLHTIFLSLDRYEKRLRVSAKLGNFQDCLTAELMRNRWLCFSRERWDAGGYTRLLECAESRFFSFIKLYVKCATFRTRSANSVATWC